MTLLLIASRTKRWTAWNYGRVATNFLIGIGLCLLSLIQLNDEHATAFRQSPWVLPTLLIVFFIVLVINHLPQPPAAFFGKKKKKEQDGSANQAELVAGGRSNSWDVIGHLGYRSRRAHDKMDPAVSSVPAQGAGYESRPHTGANAV